MKQYKYLYSQMLNEDVIRNAYKKLRKGKTKRIEIQLIDNNLDEEVKNMRQMIFNTRPCEVPNPELAYVPRKRTQKRIIEHGKERIIYMPEIHEQWLHHIIVLILEPIILKTAHKNTCGSFPKRGAHYGKRAIERWIRSKKGIKYFAKLDIRHFYNNVQLKVLDRELRMTIKDEWFIYIIEKALQGFEKGLPLGFYISQWLANYLLEPLDMMISKEFPNYIRYMDDIVIFGNAKKDLHKMVVKIKIMLGRRFRLKLKGNYQVIKFDYEKKGKRIGRPLDYMGFVFFRNRTTIRKKIMIVATRAAKYFKKHERWYIKKVQAMISQIGWFTHTDSYNCYLYHIKPHVEVKKMKRIISADKKRRNNRDRMDERKKLETA